MPKIPVVAIESSEFDQLVADINEAKDAVKKWQEYQKKKEEELEAKFSTIDPSSDFEGVERLDSEAYTVKITHKLTRKVDKQMADYEIKKLGCMPETLFNVKYDYSATLFYKLNDEQKNAVLDSMTTKRARSSLEITLKEA